MATPLFRPLKRLRSKVTDRVAYGLETQESLPAELFADDGAAKRQVYLVTRPHPSQERAAAGTPLRAPNTYSRQFLLDALLDSCASPIYDKGNAGRGLGGVHEHHTSDLDK